MSGCSILTNQLVTVEVNTGQDDTLLSCLMGLINLENKVKEMEGWILLISGKPLIPFKSGVKIQNKLFINSLHLTPNQKKTIREGSIDQDNYVYLYTGKYKIGNCQRTLHPEERRRFLFSVLSAHMRDNCLELDIGHVAPLNLKHIIRRVVMPRRVKMASGPYPPILNSVEENKSPKITIRYFANRITVELECSANHSGYHVGIILLQTFVPKQDDMATFSPQNFTQIIDQADVRISPGSWNQGLSSDGRKKILNFVIKEFELPSYKKQIAFDSRIEYRGIAYFICNGVWEKITVEKLNIKPIAKNDEGIDGTGSGTVTQSSLLLQKKSMVLPSPISCTPGRDSYDIKIKLIVMEVELEREGRDVTRASTW